MKLQWTVANSGLVVEWISVGTKGTYKIQHDGFTYAVSVVPSRYEGHDYDRLGHMANIEIS